MRIVIAALWIALGWMPSHVLAEASDACPATSPWSEHRSAAERSIQSGDAHPIEEFSDGSLGDTVRRYWSARIAKDVAAVLELEIELSDEHLAVEARRLRELFSEDDRIPLSTGSPSPYSYWTDKSNPAHVSVYSTVLVRIGARCLQDGAMTEWIRLEGEWYTFPAGSSFRVLKKGRPNRGYQPE